MQSNIEIRSINTNEAYVSLTLKIGDIGTRQPFNITVKMCAKFFWDESIDTERVKKMLNINAPAVLLSYIRPIVYSMTGSSRYSALSIPFIDFTQEENK